MWIMLLQTKIVNNDIPVQTLQQRHVFYNTWYPNQKSYFEALFLYPISLFSIIFKIKWLLKYTPQKKRKLARLMYNAVAFIHTKLKKKNMKSNKRKKLMKCRLQKMSNTLVRYTISKYFQQMYNSGSLLYEIALEQY